MSSIIIPNFIQSAYNDVRRVRHGLNHLHEMFDYIQTHSVNPISNELVQAVLFHDIVYDMNRSDNEEKSVKKWLDHCQDFPTVVKGIDINKVSNMIMSTKYPTNFDTDHEDTQLLLRADWAVFEYDIHKLDKYERDIYLEYNNFVGPNTDYYCKRLAFLSTAFKQYRQYGGSCKYLINSLYDQMVSKNIRKDAMTDLEKRAFSNNRNLRDEYINVYTDITYHMNTAKKAKSNSDILKRARQMETLREDISISLYRDKHFNYNHKILESIYTIVSTTLSYYTILIGEINESKREELEVNID